jgi:hypothetical protein
MTISPVSSDRWLKSFERQRRQAVNGKGGRGTSDVSVQYGRYRLAADGERVGSADHDPPCVVGCQAIAGQRCENFVPRSKV